MIYKRRKTNASIRNRHSSSKVDTRHCIITYRIRIDEITCQFDGFQTKRNRIILSKIKRVLRGGG